MALVHFLAGKHRGKTATVDDAVVSAEGRYRFKKREITNRGGRAYYLKAVRGNAGPTGRFRSGRLPSMTTTPTDHADP